MSAEPATNNLRLFELFWLGGALARVAQLPREQHERVRRSAREAEQCLRALALLCADTGSGDGESVPALRERALKLTLVAYLAAHGGEAATPEAPSELLAAARSAGLAPALCDALATASSEASPGPEAERALATILRELPARTRDELLWLRVVRCVAVPSIVLGVAFVAGVVKHRTPSSTEQTEAPRAAPARPASPARPGAPARSPGTPP